MSYFERHIAPVSAKPSSRAPLFARATYFWNRPRIGTEILCQPTQASRSAFGSVLWRRISLSCSRSRQSVFPAGQYLPLPYVPSICETICVNSSLSAGFDGAASVSESFSNLKRRSRSAGILRRSKRDACLASSMVAVMLFSSALAARISVSWVMWVDRTQLARLDSTASASSFVSVDSMNFLASATVGGGAAIAAADAKASNAIPNFFTP